jgi:hypothetical protein
MIRVAVEVREGATLLREKVSAESVRQAVSVMRERYPGRDVRVVFPISPEDFFLEGPKKAEGEPDDGQQEKPSFPTAFDASSGAMNKPTLLS